MDISEKNIVGEVVAQDYRTAAVFRSYGIDFCCQGNISIAEACDRQHLVAGEVIGTLEDAVKQKEAVHTAYDTWPLDLLADYIEKKHHRYVEAKIPEIKPYLQKIVHVHGSRHPELAEIADLFFQSAGELTMHMKKEEFILFPYIRKMMRAQESSVTPSPPPFGVVENPISMMKHEHDEEGERFRKIASLSNNYTPPQDACGTYQVTFALLREFQDDLHLHIHLENNILFPKAIDLEKALHDG